MDPEVKQLLEENLRISKENNLLLIKVRNVQRWAQITRILYWVVIIGISFGALYYIKPYLGNLINVYSGGASGVENISDISSKLKDQQQIQDLIKSLNE
ncbi:MAG: hypothetical protein WCT42_00900 [Candidatus Paceibacterota bacterium]